MIKRSNDFSNGLSIKSIRTNKTIKTNKSISFKGDIASNLSSEKIIYKEKSKTVMKNFKSKRKSQLPNLKSYKKKENTLQISRKYSIFNGNRSPNISIK